MFGVRGLFGGAGRPVAEAGDGEIGNGGRRLAVDDQIGDHFAHGGGDLETVAGEAEGVDQAGRGGGGAEHRDVVGHL